MQKWFQKRRALAALMGALLISGLAGCAYPPDGYYGNYPGYPAYAGDYYYGYYDPWFIDFYWPSYYGGWGYYHGGDHHEHHGHSGHNFAGAHAGGFHGHSGGGTHAGAAHGAGGHGGGRGGGHGR